MKPKEPKQHIPIITPEEIEKRNQEGFVIEYNELVKKYRYTLTPVLRFELQRLPEPQQQVDGNTNNPK